MSSITAMQAPVLTALRGSRRTAAVGCFHERRASNTDRGVFPSVAPSDGPIPSKLRLLLSGSKAPARPARTRR